MNSLLIFTENVTPRLEYVCSMLFSRYLGIEYQITSNQTVFNNYSGPSLNYSFGNTSQGIHIVPSGLLFEQGIERQKINTVEFQGLQVPFSVQGGSLPFDIFSAVFYLLSRYEEYLPFEQNQYGQFKATDSLACKMGFLDKPVVDIWAGHLKTMLADCYPALQFKKRKFSATFTYDVDVAYAYKGRNVINNTGLIIKDFISLKFNKLTTRLKVLNGNLDDPFDTYRHIEKLGKKFGHNVISFFLVGPRNRYNRNLSPYGKAMKELVKKESAIHNSGIHPSYFTNDNFLQLQHEKLLLESLSGIKITVSRQHYLRLIFPITYNNLVNAGITDEYTLGFAEMPGFRAGTCTAFNFYDLKMEKQTSLLLHPNTFMEGTFIEDMQLSPAESFEKMKKLVDEVKKVNGEFICIWHNHSLSDEGIWKGMKEVHDQIAAYAATE